MVKCHSPALGVLTHLFRISGVDHHSFCLMVVYPIITSALVTKTNFQFMSYVQAVVSQVNSNLAYWT